MKKGVFTPFFDQHHLARVEKKPPTVPFRRLGRSFSCSIGKFGGFRTLMGLFGAQRGQLGIFMFDDRAPFSLWVKSSYYYLSLSQPIDGKKAHKKRSNDFFNLNVIIAP